MDNTDKVLGWLLGQASGLRPADLADAGIPYSAGGILGRLFKAFPGDPVGPAQVIAVGTTPTGLTLPGLAVSATISIETTACRIQMDGTEATTAAGLLLPVGAIFTITGHDTMIATRICGTGAGSAFSVQYWT